MKIISNLNKKFLKWALKIDKRIRLVISVGVMSFFILFSTFFYFDRALIFVPLIFIVAYFLTYFAVLEKIERVGFLGLFIMPEAVAISFYFFYFLFPGRWITRIPYLVIFAISFYAVLLCSNIFNVGVEKSLGLYRAAFSINFFYQSIVSFLIFNLIFVSQNNFLVNGILSGSVAFVLSLNLFWTIRLKKYLEREVWQYALLVAIAVFEAGILASFLPVQSTVYALFLTGCYYSVAGIIYNYIDERLFKETIREYATVFFFIILVTILATSW